MRRWLIVLVAAAIGGCSPALPTPPGSSPNLSSSSPGTPASTSGLGPWKLLADSDEAGSGWSPDGRWLLTSDAVTNGTAAQRHLTLVDAHGTILRRFQGENPVELDPLWLDEQTFIVAQGGKDELGTVDSATLTPTSLPPFPGGAKASGYGALAYESSGNLDASATFVVWTPAGGPTKPHPGVPVVWSRDGTKLAVWHWSSGASGPGVTGWIEALSWPGLRSLGAIRQPTGFPFALFDASSRYLFANGLVLDLSSGSLSAMPGPGPAVSPPDNPANALLFPSLAAPLVGDQSAGVSADGSTVVIWNIAQAGPITIIRNGISQSLSVPGELQPPDASLSPNGLGIAITCIAPDGSEEALLLAP